MYNNNNKIKIELGCGEQRRDLDGYKNITVDLIKTDSVDIVCNLGFESLPFKDNYADFVQAIDVIEHIPKCMWINDENGKMKRITPLIQFMNEVFRIIKPNGKLYLETPGSAEAFYRDPTHVSFLSPTWIDYFTDEDKLYKNQGLINTSFHLCSIDYREYKWRKNDIMCITLIAEKSMPLI